MHSPCKDGDYFKSEAPKQVFMVTETGGVGAAADWSWTGMNWDVAIRISKQIRTHRDSWPKRDMFLKKSKTAELAAAYGVLFFFLDLPHDRPPTQTQVNAGVRIGSIQKPATSQALNFAEDRE